MKLVRPAVALATLACLAGGVSAHAATKPKPVCNLITDGAGDASLQPPVPSDDSLDIISGDVASDAKKVTAVIRLKNLGATSPATYTGRNYYAQFTLPGAQYPIYFSAENDGIAVTYKWGDLEPGSGGLPTYTSKGDAAGTLDKAKNEIRLTVPVSDLSAFGKAKPGSKLSELHLSTTAVLGILVADVDTADGSKSYVAGTLSCVKP